MRRLFFREKNMAKAGLKVFAIVLLFSLFGCNKVQTEVMVCSTLHGAHRKNLNYTYDTLFRFIEKYNPDVIGMEIRPEDISREQSYLENFYPYEFHQCIEQFPEKGFYGFDWLGDEGKGQPLSDSYFENLELMHLRKQFAGDRIMQTKSAVLDTLAKQKNQIALSASLSELNNGVYDSLNTLYYRKMAALFKETKYQGITDFYQRRDEEIASNIEEIIRKNPGKRMLFLMGADHRSYTMKHLKGRRKNLVPGLILATPE
jgi:hypothetical protein